MTATTSDSPEGREGERWGREGREGGRGGGGGREGGGVKWQNKCCYMYVICKIYMYMYNNVHM